ncbi:MAG TPA: adenine deaminase C-terminal domain-containing protein [Syntrophorhabdales bacterium]|nr:adenine deaminase C-terminal domain-containing protein [Syntrophorhabdales bacterium]
MQKRMLQRLLRVAKGEEPPDKIIVNGRIVNVFTNSIDEKLAISVKDGYITGLGERPKLRDSAKTEIIDAGGRYLCPGLMDAHTHLDSMYPFYEIVPYSLKGGTTCLVTECGIVATTCGMEAVESFFDSTKGYLLRCYFLAPPETPPFPHMETAIGLSLGEFKRILRRKDVLGVGEGYWTRIVEGDDRVLSQASFGLSLGKTLEGHGAGARGAKLMEYAMTGITSCHESTTVEEALEKLRLGIYVMIREGFVRKELAELKGLKDLDVDKRRIMLVSDNFDAVMLCEDGYLDSVLRRAIAYGFDPIEAIKMMTINVADYYGLRYLGAIAPLRHADILFLSDLEKVAIDHVMVNGEMVVKDREFQGEVRRYAYPETLRRTIRARGVSGSDFLIPAAGSEVRVRLIKVINETITREAEALLKVKDGCVQKDVARDIIPVAVINRNDGRRMGKGFITGTGIKEGAFATNITWDTGNILTAGSSEEEMALAANRLMEIQGGYVISKNGRVTFEFPMDVYSLVPDYSLEEISRKTKELDVRMEEIGSTLPRPFLALQTIPFTGLPFLRITDRGLADIKTRRLVPLFL